MRIGMNLANPAACTALLICLFWSVDVLAQQTETGAKPPLEYIESSSPIPGGGVVSSVYVPGQAGPVYRGGPGATPASQANASTAGNNGGQSVLDPSLSETAQTNPAQAGSTNGQANQPQVAARQAYPSGTPRVASNRGFYGQQQYGQQALPVTAYQVPAAAQIPSLGVPTRWDRSIRTGNNCSNCGPGAGYVPYGFQGAGQTGQAFYPGQQPPVAPTFPPAASTNGYFQSPGRSTYTPLFQLQSFPTNAYAGQGIIGSPKLYVDGQPIRNLMRYLWIP